MTLDYWVMRLTKRKNKLKFKFKKITTAPRSLLLCLQYCNESTQRLNDPSTQQLLDKHPSHIPKRTILCPSPGQGFAFLLRQSLFKYISFQEVFFFFVFFIGPGINCFFNLFKIFQNV